MKDQLPDQERQRRRLTDARVAVARARVAILRSRRRIERTDARVLALDGLPPG